MEQDFAAFLRRNSFVIGLNAAKAPHSVWRICRRLTIVLGKDSEWNRFPGIYCFKTIKWAPWIASCLLELQISCFVPLWKAFATSWSFSLLFFWCKLWLKNFSVLSDDSLDPPSRVRIYFDLVVRLSGWETDTPDFSRCNKIIIQKAVLNYK